VDQALDRGLAGLPVVRIGGGDKVSTDLPRLIDEWPGTDRRLEKLVVRQVLAV
jgi:hypothetical protein